MKGLNYLSNDKGNKVAIQIDPNNRDNSVNEFLMNFENMFDSENILKEENVPYELVRKKLMDGAQLN